MKKLFLLLLILFMLVGCDDEQKTQPVEKTLEDYMETIAIPNETKDNLNLEESYTFDDQNIIAIWESNNPDIISNQGVVERDLEEHLVTLKLILSNGNEIKEKEFTVKVLPLTIEEYLQEALDKIEMPLETKNNLNLRNRIVHKSISNTITWTTNKPDVLSNSGEVGLLVNDEEVLLTASITYQNITKTKNFSIKVLSLSTEEKVSYIFDHLDIPNMTAKDITLPTSFPFGFTGVWTSSDSNIISNDGIINKNLQGQKQVTLTLTLSNNERRTFEIMISNTNHLIKDESFLGTKTNTTITNKQLVLEDGKLEGTYESEVIYTLDFSSAVASWAALTSQEATVELEVRVLVNDNWSKYFSYGQWGLGLKNSVTNQNDSIAKLSTDEIIISNSKLANALQFRVTLNRTSLSSDLPKVNLLVAALEIPNYSYPVDISNLKQTVDYAVPTLYQHDVPSIGNVICSPTSSTMLLKYKGHDFTNEDTLEHRYIANLFYDNGDFQAYGNWVYNTVGISSFGEISYVQRMYSYQELIKHLAEVGPVAASIKGTVVLENANSYYTNGHLIVVRGYRFDGDQLYIIVNDPNVKNVHDEMTVEAFMNVWRNICYIVE